MSILTSFVWPMSSLFLEKASPYSSHSSLNFCLISVVMVLSCSCTLQGPGTSAGEQIKAVSCGISGSVLCLWGTQFHGLARCSLILSLLASSMLYVSSIGSSAKAIPVSLPMYRWSTMLRLNIVSGIYLWLYWLLGLLIHEGGIYICLGFCDGIQYQF